MFFGKFADEQRVVFFVEITGNVIGDVEDFHVFAAAAGGFSAGAGDDGQQGGDGADCQAADFAHYFYPFLFSLCVTVTGGRVKGKEWIILLKGFLVIWLTPVPKYGGGRLKKRL